MSIPNTRRVMLQRLEAVKGIVEVERKERAKFKAMGMRYPNLGPLGYDDLTVTLFECLANSPSMGPVWMVLESLFDDHKEQPDTLVFANACNQVYKTWSWTKTRTPSEHQKYYAELAFNLMQTAHRLALDPAFGAFGEMPAPLHPLQLVDMDELEEYFEIVAPGEASDLVSHLRDVLPGFYEQSMWLSKQALKIAAQPPLSQRPGRKEAHRTYFVKGLSKWFDHHFEKQFRGKYEVIAAVASALFPELDRIITAEDVRKLKKSKAEVSIDF